MLLGEEDMCILYHGGNMILEKPEIHVPSRPLDFGEGFYTTFSREQDLRFIDSEDVIQ